MARFYLFLMVLAFSAVLARGLRIGSRNVRLQTYGQLRPYSVQSLHMCVSTDLLNNKIATQGAMVRELKAAKADKDDIKAAVDALLALKAELSVITGPAEPAKAYMPKKEKQENVMTSKEQRIAAKAKAGGGGKGKTGKKEEPSQTLEEIRANRIEKLEAMKTEGINPFEYTFQASHKATELQVQYGDKLSDGEEDPAGAGEYTWLISMPLLYCQIFDGLLDSGDIALPHTRVLQPPHLTSALILSLTYHPLPIQK